MDLWIFIVNHSSKELANYQIHPYLIKNYFCGVRAGFFLTGADFSTAGL